MIISDEHQFVMIAVPKTATTSIEAALAPYGRAYTKVLEGKHSTASEVRAQMPAEKWDRYFKFAFVRHPLDWMLSWYTYRQRPDLQDPWHPNHHRSTVQVPFATFIEDRMWGDKLQCDYVMDDDDELLVDFVGHFENMESDLATVCRRIGIPCPQVPVRNRSPLGDYSNLYTEELRREVLELSRREMKHLGYDVDYRWQAPRFEGPVEESRRTSRTRLLGRTVRRQLRNRFL